jgi:hypothetical protein
MTQFCNPNFEVFCIQILYDCHNISIASHLEFQKIYMSIEKIIFCLGLKKEARENVSHAK